MLVRRMTDRRTFRPHEEMNQQFRFRNQLPGAKGQIISGIELWLSLFSSGL